VPIPFECGKDKTKCIEIATWNRRLDMIDGFCGFLISPQHPTHQCKSDISPSSTTWTSIKNAFKTLQVGTMCCVLVVDPLMVGLPRLVYYLLSIYNQFGHLQVESQWELIQKLHKKYLEENIGPL
jgi:hypothetical protein